MTGRIDGSGGVPVQSLSRECVPLLALELWEYGTMVTESNIYAAEPDLGRRVRLGPRLARLVDVGTTVDAREVSGWFDTLGD